MPLMSCATGVENHAPRGERRRGRLVFTNLLSRLRVGMSTSCPPPAPLRRRFPTRARVPPRARRFCARHSGTSAVRATHDAAGDPGTRGGRGASCRGWSCGGAACRAGSCRAASSRATACRAGPCRGTSGGAPSCGPHRRWGGSCRGRLPAGSAAARLRRHLRELRHHVASGPRRSCAPAPCRRRTGPRRSCAPAPRPRRTDPVRPVHRGRAARPPGRPQLGLLRFRATRIRECLRRAVRRPRRRES